MKSSHFLKLSSILALFLFSFCSTNEIQDQETNLQTSDLTFNTSSSAILPEDYVQDLGKGFDVTWSEFSKYMDLYSEDAVIDFSNAGFKNVRIRMNDPNPDQVFMDRLKMQVDHCLAHGVYPILAYQGHYLEETATTDEEARLHLTEWWRKMAEEFQDYPPQLTFNIMVEISGRYKLDYAAMNSFYVDVLAAIRETNQNRIVIFPPVKISDPEYLQFLEIPGENDQFTMAEWHFFAAGPRKDPSNKKYWLDGKTVEERANVTGPIQTAVNWMNQTGYKTWVGAWMSGNYNKGNDFSIPDQVSFSSFMTRELENAGIPWSINAGNKFYDYATNEWFTTTVDAAGIPVRDALIDPYKISLYSGSDYSGDSVRLAPGVYDEAYLRSIGFFNNVGSIMIPFDFKVSIYKNDNAKGKADVYSMTDNNFNKPFSSIKIEYLNSY